MPAMMWSPLLSVPRETKTVAIGLKGKEIQTRRASESLPEQEEGSAKMKDAPSTFVQVGFQDVSVSANVLISSQVR